MHLSRWRYPGAGRRLLPPTPWPSRWPGHCRGLVMWRAGCGVLHQFVVTPQSGDLVMISHGVLPVV
jgi:hypothetical protein